MSESNKQELSLKLSAKIVRKTLSLIWSLSKTHFTVYFAGAISEIIGTVITALASAKLITSIILAIGDASFRSEVWFWLVIVVGAQLLINVGFWLMNYGRRIIFILSSRWSSMTFMRQLSTIDIKDFYETNIRNDINKLEAGHSWRISNLTGSVLELVYGILRAIVIILIAANIAWWVVPILIAFMIPSLIAETRTSKAGWFVWDEKGDERHVFWGISWLMSKAGKQMEIRVQRARSSLLKIVDDMLIKFQNKQRKIFQKANRIIGISKVFEVAGIAIVEIWLIFRVLYQRSLGIESYLFFSQIVARISGAVNAVFASYINMQESVLYARDFFGFMELTPVLNEESKGTKLKTNKIPKIEFKNVWFKYPGSDEYVFKNLNLTIKPGEHIALVGENGAGKTTLVKLLMRFYQPEKGQILVDDMDLMSISLKTWYMHLGVLFQEFNQYPLNIEDNIAISGLGKKDPIKLKKAMKQSGADKIVENSPKGIETVLDSSFEDGVEPSGGQWQKIALARTFYRNPNVLILDEPTAAIDAKAEYEIFNNIFKQQKNKTAIIISHRFSTVRRADRIVVLDIGNIKEMGSHQELLKANGLYKEMFEKQASGYR